MAESRSCAYCGSVGTLTREHLWPAGIIRRADVRYSYLGKNESYIDAELTIKDVCAACNNGPLSELDAYICTLFDAQFHRQAAKHETRNFLYDYPKLLRWLLKISFNVARANGTDGPVLAVFADYIRDGVGAPPPNVQVRLELIHPSANPRWVPGSDAMKEIRATTIRCARVMLPEDPFPGATLRMVALHSYYFWLVVVPPQADAAAFLEGLPGKAMHGSKGRVAVSAKRGMLEVHEHWLSNPRANASMRKLRPGRKSR